MSWFWKSDPTLPEVVRRLKVIEGLIRNLECKMTTLTEALAVLTAQVDENTSVNESAIILIQGLADQIASVATDPTQVVELAGRLKASAEALAAAVSANTPVAPPVE